LEANPVLVEQTRGPLVENRYRGAFAIVDASGATIAAAGDIGRPVFPRSAVKSMQALALFTSGAVDSFALSDADLALACASHHGEEPHLAGVDRILRRIGATTTDLECGAHQPVNAAARAALRQAGGQPTPLHNNCSGKHAGMLAVARALDVPMPGYVQRDHAVQHAVRAGLEAVLGEPLDETRCGTDGCSIPTWATPLTTLARGFARMATGEGLPDGLAHAARRTFDAATAHPLLVAGTGHFDTQVMQAFSGRLMQKGGAEGVQCGAIRDRGLGYAVKIDDGNMAASIVVAAALLLRFAEPDAVQQRLLEGFARQPVRNVRGLDVGALRIAPTFS
jgi:L-asparaginase II